VPRRRFQRGTFVKEANGGFYSMHYIDVERPAGSLATKQVKRFIGNLNQMSERAARSEHARIMVDGTKNGAASAPRRKAKLLKTQLPNGGRQSRQTSHPQPCGHASHSCGHTSCPVSRATPW